MSPKRFKPGRYASDAEAAQHFPSSGPILARCDDPATTRRLAAFGAPVPCYRCLAWRPDLTDDGRPACFFIVRREQMEARP